MAMGDAVGIRSMMLHHAAQQRYPHSENDLPSGFFLHQAYSHVPSLEQSLPKKEYRSFERGLQALGQQKEQPL